MAAVFLQLIDRRRIAADRAAGPIPSQRVPRLESQIPVDAAGGRARRQHVAKAVARPALRPGQHEPDRGLVREFAAHAADRIAGQRLDGLRGKHRPVLHARLRFLAHRLHDADRILTDPSRQLGRAENLGLRRHVRIDVVPARQIVGALGRAAHPPRVEHAAARAVVAVEIEVEVAGSLDEERPPLVEVRFERRQVHNRRIRLHLSEIRIHRRREREAGRQRVLHVQADRAVRRGALHERIAAGWLLRQIRQRVRHDLELLRRRRHRQAAELTERRHVAVGAAREQRPRRRFVHPADLARHGEAERARRRRVEAQLGERDSELSGPALAVARHADVPHRVPAVVEVVVVEPVAVHLHARRVHGELVRGPVIMIRVDQDVDPVAGRIEIAPREVGDDLVRLVVVGADLHEQRGRIVGDAELGALAGLAGVVRLALDERVNGCGGLPDLVAQLAAGPHRPGGRDGDGIHARRRGCGRCRREREREHPENHDDWRN